MRAGQHMQGLLKLLIKGVCLCPPACRRKTQFTQLSPKALGSDIKQKGGVNGGEQQHRLPQFSKDPLYSLELLKSQILLNLINSNIPSPQSLP